MYWNVVIFIFSIGATVMFVQHDYIVDINYVKLDYYNPSVIQHAELKNVKPNRTFRALSLCSTILVDFENPDLYKMNIKAYKIISNVPMKTPIFQTDVKIIELRKKNLFGFMDVLENGNITGFPIKKGTYCLNNFHIDSNRLPPFIPGGEYKSQLTLMYGETVLAKISGYGKVIYKIKQGH